MCHKMSRSIPSNLILLIFLLGCVIVALCSEVRNGKHQQSDEGLMGFSSSIRNNNKKNIFRRGQRLKNNRNALRLLAGLSKHNIQGGGSWPPVINVAAKSLITANATCGENGPEEYCDMIDADTHRSRAAHCGICDANSTDFDKRHHIEYAIDGTNRYWQSPSLHNGEEFEYVTITLDLKQTYQITYIKLFTAISPTPASWILERSLDGEKFEPWQYFSSSDSECLRRYNLSAHHATRRYRSDTEVSCTTKYSKQFSLENGKINLPLINHRPGANISSLELLEFTLARYIRIRLQSMQETERRFYSFRHIKIGGRLDCSGHASETTNSGDDMEECLCSHHTCGSNCEKCCPMYNQRAYMQGTLTEINRCEKCECYGHANECYYNPEVDQKGLSINTEGIASGGGVCINCTDLTAGINCEKCIPHYYRPYTVSPDAVSPCIPCDCDANGSEGPCNSIGGECSCKSGFIGPKCDECASGYKGEQCSKCACDIRGTMHGGECESHCQCKLHVEGKVCDKCLPGYFALSAGNSEGCMKCYCSGVSQICTSHEVNTSMYQTLENWKVTDIAQQNFAYPSRDNDTGNLVFGMYEFPETEAVYWLAPGDYCGNLLRSYGSYLSFHMAWVIVRGDTSGKPTSGPSVILVGKNGMKIAQGDNVFKNSNASIDVQLSEDGWYHVPRTVKDIVTRLRRTEYRGDPVTRVQFMSVLSDVESILIRGTFHTDQVESVLVTVTLNSGFKYSEKVEFNSVEKCECPIGYSGLSCESCAFGFVRVYENSTTHEKLGKCVPCACNGHAASCDLELDTCGECQHNTYGERCERCAAGYYGFAMYGTENDCKRCSCPLLIESNNFSPSCQLTELSMDVNRVANELFRNLSVDYICTQCPDGYTGAKCEICDDGFYGQPEVIGSKCLPCPCNGGPCDPNTGRCISCLGNTEGWRCERCKDGYWGDPHDGCELCNCYESGSLSNVCDVTNGQCVCKPRYGGHQCDECEFGYGNITLECQPCECNINGSTDTFCDTETGQCPCKMGIEGLKCDQCMDTYYGLSTDGCEECRCNPYGSVNRSCNRYQGRCHCHPNVTGRQCDRCQSGYWHLESGRGCRQCVCDTTGSVSSACDYYTGQCSCKPGIGGVECNQCLDGYYGFSSKGCRKCDECPNSAFICDSESGRCVCPELSKGSDCQHCYPNSWGWEHRKGCRLCDCDHSGSIGQSCDLYTGHCICREGYDGRRCDRCASGYYGYPDCRRCSCNKDGSITSENGVIQCDDFGQCPCKPLVTGLKCDQCRQSTFGISKANPDGCTRCFCFGRSQDCQQSDLIWGQIRSYGSRNLSVEYVPSEYEYVVVIQMEGSRMSREDAEIEIMFGIHLIPSSIGNVSIGSRTAFRMPLYFQLPVQFYGDRLASYDGFLKYSIATEGQHTPIDQVNPNKFPLVQLHAHNNLILDYYGSEESQNSVSITTYSIKMNELHWRYHYNGHNITRAIMMTALQNVKHIFVRGTWWADFTQVVISDVTLDTGIYVSGAKNNIAVGVEACDCPQQFNGTSCQDPGFGHYRWKDWEKIEEELEDFIGRSVPCNCNGRSDSCDMETGYCQNCRDHTGGANCEVCQEGYYGDANNGCHACPCPETNRNFARGCTVHKGKVSCICKTGYTGHLCDKCQLGFYGNTEGLNGKCNECDCDPDGIVSNECDEITGQCNCKPGVTGRRCDRCDRSKYILQDSQCRICDNCTLTLLTRTDDLAEFLEQGANHIDLNGVPAPWSRLLNYENQSKLMEGRLNNFYEVQTYIEDFNDDAIEKLLSKASHVNKRLQKLVAKSDKRNHGSENVKNEFFGFLNFTNQLTLKIQNTIDELNSYGTHDRHINLHVALSEAQRLLEDIRTRSMSHDKAVAALMCARDALEFWSSTSETLTQQTLEVEQLKYDTAMINNRLNDAIKISENTLTVSDRVAAIHAKNLERFNALIARENAAKALKQNIVQIYNNSIVPQTDELFEEIGDSQTKLLQIMEDINVLKETVNDTNAECADGLADIRENYLPDAKHHSNDLMKRATEYAKLFKNTKDGAAVALMASTAHKDITDAITAANEMTKQAKTAVAKSQEELYPPSGMSVIDIGMISLKKSHDIQQDALREIDKLGDLEDNLKRHQKIVDTIKNTIWQTGLTNNNISSTLNTLNNNATMKIVVDHLNTSSKISDQMREVRRGAVDISSDVYKLKLKLTSLEPQWDSKLGMAEENVSQSLSNIRATNNTLNNIETISAKNNEKFQKWNNTIGIQLQELRDKIAKARHAAEGIRVSLESSTPKCIRSYIPHAFGLTTSNTIKMSIALSMVNATSPLLFIQGDNSKFIAIEMVKRKIRLVWNLGGATAVVTHPTEIQTRDPKYDDAWYQIEANRTMNLGSLVVRQMTNAGTYLPSPVHTGMSSIEHSRLMISPSNRIWVGGIPADIKPRELQSDVGLAVVIHQLFIDDSQIGLWHFAHSEGECNGAMLGAHGASSASNSRHFNGEGYSAISRVGSKLYKNNVFSLQMTFKTLDENALLFLAVDDKNNRSISLTLHDGRIVFRIDYGGESKLEINTTKKYNSGTWVKVEASRAFTKKTSENGNLKVNNEEEKTGSPTTPITSNLLPELSEAIYYLGGVPPGFRSGITKAPGADHAFLGCLKDLQINEDAYDPLGSSSYFGVEPTCKDSLTKAGFYGNGYIELPSHSLRKRANFGFVFRTLQPDCLIMLSAYPPSTTEEYDSKDKKGNYSVSLIEGHAHVWIDAGTGRLELISNVTVNDGEYHVLSVQRQGRKFELRIDDEFQTSRSFQSNRSAINMPGELGGLYFGGAPDFPEYDHLAPASAFVGFQGSIKDVVFNNRTMLFNEALNFTNVQIGRSGPLMGFQGMNDVLMKTEPIGKSFTAAPEGCHRVGIYSYEPNAFKFGDGPHSHSMVNIPTRHLWQKNFNIQFDFRTFYPNGVLFVAPGTKEKQKHFIALILRDGLLNLIVRGRKKEELILPKRSGPNPGNQNDSNRINEHHPNGFSQMDNKLNDGQWHHVTLNSVAKKLSVRVDIGMNGHHSSAIIKLPKKLNAANMMYVGGVSDNSLSMPVELVSKLEEFKGCVRRFRVNNNTQDLVRPGRHFNVGQCFPRVEKGSYFPGDAYAVYKRNFHVGKYLELEFEFRTSELNGVLLSVSESVGFPALSIELHGGKVVMSCDLGDGNPFRVETHNLPSKFTLCDNRWHNVTAMYDSEQIALRIDNYDSIITLAQHRMSGKVNTKSPLYIGGLPDTAPSGTLLSRDSFKGCIRNVLIRDELKDWTDMDELHNILLSECLAIH